MQIECTQQRHAGHSHSTFSYHHKCCRQYSVGNQSRYRYRHNHQSGSYIVQVHPHFDCSCVCLWDTHQSLHKYYVTGEQDRIHKNKMWQQLHLNNFITIAQKSLFFKFKSTVAIAGVRALLVNTYVFTLPILKHTLINIYDGEDARKADNIIGVLREKNEVGTLSIIPVFSTNKCT